MLNARHRGRWRSDETYRLSQVMSGAVYKALSGAKGGSSWEAVVDFTLDELKQHLEQHFESGMTWDNFGEWHVDHVIPKSLFSYESPDDPEFRLCWSLRNLRPMWGAINVAKNDTLPDGRRARDLTPDERQHVIRMWLGRAPAREPRQHAPSQSRDAEQPRRFGSHKIPLELAVSALQMSFDGNSAPVVARTLNIKRETLGRILDGRTCPEAIDGMAFTRDQCIAASREAGRRERSERAAAQMKAQWQDPAWRETVKASRAATTDNPTWRQQHTRTSLEIATSALLMAYDGDSKVDIAAALGIDRDTVDRILAGTTRPEAIVGLPFTREQCIAASRDGVRARRAERAAKTMTENWQDPAWRERTIKRIKQASTRSDERAK